MRHREVERDHAPIWEVASPARPGRIAGVTMAGFRDRGMTPAGLRVIPHPAVTLAVVFGSGSITVGDATGRQQHGSLVAGLGFEALQVLRAERFACLQVRLSPVIARAVLGAGPAELGGAVVTLNDLWGREASRIAEQLEDACSWEDRFALMDEVLVRRMEMMPAVDAEISHAWDRVVGSRGMVRVDDIATELEWSRTRLWSRFHSQIGLPPKRAAKLVRFDYAAHRLVAGQDAARVAADCGFADQSHLHRDVQALTGLTPATVANEPFLTVDSVAWPDAQQQHMRRDSSPLNDPRSAGHAST